MLKGEKIIKSIQKKKLNWFGAMLTWNWPICKVTEGEVKFQHLIIYKTRLYYNVIVQLKL